MTTANPVERDDLPVHDFARPSRMAGDQLRALNAMHEIQAEQLSDWFTAKLREPVVVRLTNIKEQTFDDILGGLERPSCAYLYQVQGGGELTVMFLFDPGVAFGGVDRLLGGTGEPTIPERGLTVLEQQVARLIAERLRESLEATWEEHAPFRTAFVAFESMPDLLSFAEPGEPFLVSTFEVQGDGWSGEVHAHAPFALLESALAGVAHEGMSETSQVSPVVERGMIETSILRARVTLDARLPAFTVALGELRNLAPGMVLNTRIPTTSPVEISVSGQTRFTALAGRKGHELAVRILESADGGHR